MESPSLKMFKNYGDVALGDMDSGHNRNGLGLGLEILEVFNLSDSVILCNPEAKCRTPCLAAERRCSWRGAPTPAAPSMGPSREDSAVV